MIGAAAANDGDPLCSAQLEVHLREVYRALRVEAPKEGVAQGGWLIVDLLEHVVLKYPKLDVLGLPVHLEGLALYRLPFEREDSNPRARDLHYLAVLNQKEPAGLLDEGPNRAGQVVLILPQPHNERALVPGANHLARLAQRRSILHAFGEQVRYDLGVGIRGEADAALDQLLLELGEVLDDAVVDDGDAAGPDLGMCVSRVWRAVGSPASVSNPSPRLREVAVALAKGLGQPPQPPGLLDGLYAAVELQREPSGVITPVLELPQTLHEDL